MKKKRLPIGNSDFKEIIEENFYYIDKSLFIQELLDDGSKITIITRPRRFGKTLNMMMLKYWFEKYSINQLINTKGNEPKTEHAYLFHNLKIWRLSEEYKKHCGRYPVVFLTFKDLKSSSWEKCYDKIQNVIREEFLRHKYLLDSQKLDEMDKHFINKILQNSEKEADFELSLLKLIKFLSRHYNEKVVVLIDEYDTPIHESYLNGYYDKVLDFLRSFLGAGLKDNTNLQYAIITGILRVSRESIFSDLNNTSIFTILEKTYSDKFGILENEVIKMFQDFGIMDDLKDVRSWYNGYMIGDTPNLYNPWSIVNYVQYHNDGLKPYWVNTSSNQMIKDLMAEGSSDIKQDIESLVQNKPIEKRIDPFIVFKDLDRNTDVVWTLFLFSGYLKVNGYRIDESNKVHYSLSIPNYEVKSIIERFLEQWLTDFISNHELEMFTKSLLTGDAETVENILQKYVIQSMSYFDKDGSKPEKVYHAFVLGLLIFLNDRYLVKSNGESGYGRYDICLIPKTPKSVGVVIEFKVVNSIKKETLETALSSALKQIEEKQYTTELLAMGSSKVYQYAMAFQGKTVKVALGF